jgi:glycosyltransferase involved in cell wall biosynthesis
MRRSMAIVRPYKPNLAELAAYAALQDEYDLTFFYAGVPEASCRDQLAKIGCDRINVVRYRTLADLRIPALVQRALDYKVGLASIFAGDLEAVLEHEIVNIVDPIYFYTTQLVPRLRLSHRLVLVRWELIPGRYEEPLMRRAMKTRILDRADAIICTTDAALHSLPAVHARAKKTRIYPGVVTAAAAGVSTHAHRITSIARLGWQKGTGDLIGAIAVLRDHFAINAELELIGGGETAPWRRLAHQLGVTDRVNFVGQLPLSTVQQHLAETTVYCQPSLTSRTWCEQFGFAAVEAMMAARPVVAYDSGVLAEVLGKDGILVPAHNAARLADGLARVFSLDPSGRRAQGERMRARALEHFDATKQGQKLRHFLRELH